VDGTRDRPPGKTAQIAGRKDGIRAGAVSGPWRSGPAAEGVPARKPELPRPPGQPGPIRATPATGARAPLVARAGLSEHATPIEHAAVTPLSSQQTRRSIAWIAFGVLVALGAVVAAVMFRAASDAPEPAVPELAAGQAAPAQPSPDAITAAPAATATPAAAAGDALAHVSVVRLRVGPGFPAERQSAILAALKGAGIAEVKVEALPFEVATSRVGYYRADDVAAADALARLITPVVGSGDGQVGVRDYGKLLDDAEPGRLDLWVGD